jgi:serine/threonine protein phosphatase 1
MRKFLRLRRVAKKPSLPPGVRIYAFGDIHGRADLLGDLFKIIDIETTRSPIERTIEVYLGDYIDRGPESKRTLDMLIERSQHRETVFLMGNHEFSLLEVLANPTRLQDWRQFGGLHTLISYGLEPSLVPSAAEQLELVDALLEVMPPAHLAFLKNLKYSFSCGDFYFVHAGVRPGVPLDQQNEADLLWIRNEFLDSTEDFGKYIVHGHTPVKEPDIRPNRINIDTGAYATGSLTLLTIQGTRLLAF